MYWLLAIVILSATSRPATQPTSRPTSQPVYYREVGKRLYHRPTCRFLKEHATTQRATSQMAKADKLMPCPMCKPSDLTRKPVSQRWRPKRRPRHRARAPAVQPPRIVMRRLGVGAKGRFIYQTGGRDNPIHFEIRQIIDSRQMILEWGETVIWCKGYPTTGLVDGKVIIFRGPFKITGTKTYQTAMGGSKTVYVAEPLDDED